MLKASLKNPVLRRRARQFGRLLRHSAITPRTGRSYKPRLVSNGELGLTFIGHASFFVQIGGQNVVIDPNFARWLFVLKRLRQPGVQLHDLPPIDLVLVTHAHFDHLHRPSLRAIVQQTVRRRVVSPTIVVPHHVFDLVSDLGFENVVELDWWNSYRHHGLTITHVPSRHWGARILRDSHRGYGGDRAPGGEQYPPHPRRPGVFFLFPPNPPPPAAAPPLLPRPRLISPLFPNAPT